MGHSSVVSNHPKSIGIPRVDELSTGPPGFGTSQLGIRALVNDYLGSSGVGIQSMVLILACLS